MSEKTTKIDLDGCGCFVSIALLVLVAIALPPILTEVAAWREVYAAKACPCDKEEAEP